MRSGRRGGGRTWHVALSWRAGTRAWPLPCSFSDDCQSESAAPDSIRSSTSSSLGCANDVVKAGFNEGTHGSVGRGATCEKQADAGWARRLPGVADAPFGRE